MFIVLYMDKIRFKRGIIEALHTIVANTKDLETLKEHPEMIAKLNLFTDSFIHESDDILPKNLTLLINSSQDKLKQKSVKQNEWPAVLRIYAHLTNRSRLNIEFENNLCASIVIWVIICFVLIFFLKFFNSTSNRQTLGQKMVV